MKKIYSFIFLLFILQKGISQAPFWIETFGTGCSQGQFADNYNPTGLGVWSVVVTGTQGLVPNDWYISATEAGLPVGTCGDGCLTNTLLINRTLHISPNLLDVGAAYLAGSGLETNKRVQSPSINCTGQNSITLSFKYLVQGIINQDYFDVQASANGGTSWTVISTPPATNNGTCSGQGLWTNFTVSLPASCNNNPNVKVGFRWQNINATGADPAVALDDIALTAPNTFAATFTMQPSICVGGSLAVTANTGTYVVSGYTWTSIPGGVLFSSPNASTTVATFTNAGPYSVSLTAVSGGTTASYNQMITVNALPNVSVSASPTTICAGQSTTLSATGGTAYAWNPGALSGATVAVSPTTAIVYSVTGTGNNGCSRTRTISVNINTVNITSIASSGTICSGSSATLTANGGTAYSWNPGGLSGTSVVVTPTSTTTYSVAGTGSNTCIGNSMVTVSVVICNGINSIALNNSSYFAYPNPAKDKLTIQYNSSQTISTQIELRDALGKLINRTNHEFSSNENTFNIELNGLSAGVYFIKINSNDDARVIRFIKE